MADYVLKDIQDLDETFSKLGGTFIAVAVPTGGGNYILRKLSKENFLKMMDTPLDLEVTSSSIFPLRFKNGNGAWLYFRVDTDRVQFEGGRFQIGKAFDFDPDEYKAIWSDDGDYWTLRGKDLSRKVTVLSTIGDFDDPVEMYGSGYDVLICEPNVSFSTQKKFVFSANRTPREGDIIEIFSRNVFQDVLIEAVSPYTVSGAPSAFAAGEGHRWIMDDHKTWQYLGKL